jgi:hypothetical protein
MEKIKGVTVPVATVSCGHQKYLALLILESPWRTSGAQGPLCSINMSLGLVVHSYHLAEIFQQGYHKTASLQVQLLYETQKTRLLHLPFFVVTIGQFLLYAGALWMVHVPVLISSASGYVGGRTWLLRKIRRLVEATLSPVISLFLDELYC